MCWHILASKFSFIHMSALWRGEAVNREIGKSTKKERYKKHHEIATRGFNWAINSAKSSSFLSCLSF